MIAAFHLVRGIFASVFASTEHRSVRSPQHIFNSIWILAVWGRSDLEEVNDSALEYDAFEQVPTLFTTPFTPAGFRHSFANSCFLLLGLRSRDFSQEQRASFQNHTFSPPNRPLPLNLPSRHRGACSATWTTTVPAYCMTHKTKASSLEPTLLRVNPVQKTPQILLHSSPRTSLCGTKVSLSPPCSTHLRLLAPS